MDTENNETSHLPELMGGLKVTVYKATSWLVSGLF